MPLWCWFSQILFVTHTTRFNAPGSNTGTAPQYPKPGLVQALHKTSSIETATEQLRNEVVFTFSRSKHTAETWRWAVVSQNATTTLLKAGCTGSRTQVNTCIPISCICAYSPTHTPSSTLVDGVIAFIAHRHKTARSLPTLCSSAGAMHISSSSSSSSPHHDWHFSAGCALQGGNNNIHARVKISA
jgi:hypothetical protein